MACELSFGRWLKQRRKALDLTQEALATRVGCAADTVRKVEANRLRPSADLAARLAAVLGVPEAERAALLRSARSSRFSGARASGTAVAASPSLPPILPRAPLPLPPTPLFGREQEVAGLGELLVQQRARLLTLTGPGGIGKTRLALALAHAVVDHFSDGICLVELAPLANGELVPQVVSHALGLREQPEGPLLATLATTLHARRLLLVLDNCEHLVDACAQLVDGLLAASADVQIVATSREPLRVAAERIWPVSGLAMPARRRQPILAEVQQSAAVQLFVERAAHQQPGFGLTAANALAIVELCQRLDGVPLALELAAARVRALSVPQIVARLDDALAVLGGGPRTLARHTTLRATLDWSYHLLSPPEQQMFRYLAVFDGGWTLAAAEAIVEGGEVLGGLAQLVDKSLVVVEGAPGESRRYRLLEPARQYARALLQTHGEAAQAQRRHATFFAALVEEAADHGRWVAQLEEEHDNLRAALAWTLEQAAAHGTGAVPDREALALALRLAGALPSFWYGRGYLCERCRWLEQGLAVTATAEPDETLTLGRARAFNRTGFLALDQGERMRARQRREVSPERFQQVGATVDAVQMLQRLCCVARRQHDAVQATALGGGKLGPVSGRRQHPGAGLGPHDPGAGGPEPG